MRAVRIGEIAGDEEELAANSSRSSWMMATSRRRSDPSAPCPSGRRGGSRNRAAPRPRRGSRCRRRASLSRMTRLMISTSSESTSPGCFARGTPPPRRRAGRRPVAADAEVAGRGAAGNRRSAGLRGRTPRCCRRSDTRRRTSFPFSTSLRSMPPIEITSSSGCGEKPITRCPVGSLLRPRIFALRALNTSPLTAPGEPNRASSDVSRCSS